MADDDDRISDLQKQVISVGNNLATLTGAVQQFVDGSRDERREARDSRGKLFETMNSFRSEQAHHNALIAGLGERIADAKHAASEVRDDLRVDLNAVEERVAVVEKKVDGYENQAKGAGRIMHWLYIVGGVAAGWLTSLVSHWPFSGPPK